MRIIAPTTCGIVRCYSRSGMLYRLQCEHIEDYWVAQADEWLAVKMSRGKEPVTVRGDLDSMDRAFSEAAQNPAPPLCAICGGYTGRYQVIVRGQNDAFEWFWFCSPAHTDQWKQENPF